MTIRISLRVVAFVVYTLALLGGAFGISYAVFEWRDDDGVSNIERRIDELEGQTEAGPTKAELDAQRCAAALVAASSGESFFPLEIRDALDRYCK